MRLTTFRNFFTSIAITVLMMLCVAPSGLSRQSGATSTNQNDGIQWRTNLFGAFTDAMAQHKPMLVYFYNEEGPWCRKLQSEVFTSPEIRTLADKAVFVKVPDGLDDQSGNAKKLRDSLNITQYPTVAVLDPSPEKIVERGRVVGFYDSKSYYFQVTKILLIQPSIGGQAKQ
ncbi:MAG TPA: thioredoxin family protein [Blastocatellia bacterium]|nr:thioredoxin family protein [Blastocatellia bacterium]